MDPKAGSYAGTVSFPPRKCVCSISEDCSGVRVTCDLGLEAGVKDCQVKPRTIPLWTRVSSPSLEVCKQRHGRCGIQNFGYWIAVGLDDQFSPFSAGSGPFSA